MQKHTDPGLHTVQTRESLRLCRHYFGKNSGISFDEKRAQAEREMKRNFGIRTVRYLASLGFKVR